jgi:hypothetical protein
MDQKRPKKIASKNATSELISKAAPNPRRVAAGRLNVAKRKGFTPEGLERVRLAARRFKPWRFSTGPKTQKGKAKAALNGKKRQLDPFSVRELTREIRGLRSVLGEMETARELAKSHVEERKRR